MWKSYLQSAALLMTQQQTHKLQDPSGLLTDKLQIQIQAQTHPNPNQSIMTAYLMAMLSANNQRHLMSDLPQPHDQPDANSNKAQPNSSAHRKNVRVNKNNTVKISNNSGSSSSSSSSFSFDLSTSSPVLANESVHSLGEISHKQSRDILYYN